MVATETITQVAGRMAELRHRLHQIPELGYQEYKTAAAIRAELDALNIPYVAGVPSAPTATIAWVGDPARPCVALRADIDALPILEQTGTVYTSTHPGVMHACGHDGHIATLMGAAGVLKPLAEKLGVCIKLIWQPAEEGGGGAKRLITAGVLDGRIGPKVSVIYGLHGWPTLKVGTISSKPGEMLAATDVFSATFTGKGCHGAFPHLGVDPIVTAAEAVLNVQQFVSREFDPTESAVVTIGQFNAGSATNVIPDSATIAGTARTLSDRARKHIRESIERRFAGIASANRCQLKFDWQPGYPPTINDPAHADIVAAVARAALGPNGYLPAARPVMGGEDFAYYLEKIPGCFFFVGVEPLESNGYSPLHSARYDFTDDALPVGMLMFIELVVRFAATAK